MEVLSCSKLVFMHVKESLMLEMTSALKELALQAV